MDHFDVLVIGGGHAGCEAAAAAARLGARVALVTRRIGDIGALSCNPAIGGLGKGHLVREIDALDGLMGRVSDASAVQYRLLNRSKGPAVQGPRVQVDRRRYADAMRAAIYGQAGLTVIEAMVDDISVKSGRVTGVVTDCGPVHAKAVVVTTGTFLAATLHSGLSSKPGGRHGDPASSALAQVLAGFGLTMDRFKTGTPPRLDGRTIDWSSLEMQAGDSDHVRLSSDALDACRPSLCCGVTRTTRETHDIIRENIALAPMYAGLIEGVGPRYCPSIEDKVMRFGDRDGHQIYLEPEGYDTSTIYPNGISTSLPEAVQRDFLRTIPGLERVRMIRPGYAVEYAHIDPRSLTPALAVHELATLFLAGQVNGTTGYEEAAAQGLIAGINAARAVTGKSPVIFDRATSYLGVMIDDLVMQGVSEPYRMFTSRAEYRLSLRIDNAGARLTPTGIGIGCVAAARQRSFEVRSAALETTRLVLQRLTASPSKLQKSGASVKQDGVTRSAAEWLAYPAVDWSVACAVWPELLVIDSSVASTVATDMRYAFYLSRQTSDVANMRRDEALALPDTLDFSSVAGLSTEMVDRLTRSRPGSLGAAMRVAGVTPGALTSLLSFVRRAA